MVCNKTHNNVSFYCIVFKSGSLNGPFFFWFKQSLNLFILEILTILSFYLVHKTFSLTVLYGFQYANEEKSCR